MRQLQLLLTIHSCLLYPPSEPLFPRARTILLTYYILGICGSTVFRGFESEPNLTQFESKIGFLPGNPANREPLAAVLEDFESEFRFLVFWPLVTYHKKVQTEVWTYTIKKPTL